MEEKKESTEIMNVLTDITMQGFLYDHLLIEGCIDGFEKSHREFSSSKDKNGVTTCRIQTRFDDNQWFSTLIEYEQNSAGMRIVDICVIHPSNHRVSLKKEFFEFLISLYGISKADDIFQEYITQYEEFLKASHDLSIESLIADEKALYEGAVVAVKNKKASDLSD